MIEVNGKEYPLWSQFVERKNEWIGGILRDTGDSFDWSVMGITPMETKITDIRLEPNGDDSAYFSVDGGSFSCGFDVHFGGISGDNYSFGKDWLVFSGYGGHNWGIKK